MPDTPQPAASARFYDANRLSPEDSVGYLMRKVMSSIRTQADAQLSTHDMTYAQWLPLFKLSLCSSATTVAGLARDLETDPAAMTRVLDRLEAKGLCRRERSTEDRRVVHLSLTPAGEAATAPVPQLLCEISNELLTGFSHDEWQTFMTLLRRVAGNAETLQAQTPLSSTSNACPASPGEPS